MICRGRGCRRWRRIGRPLWFVFPFLIPHLSALPIFYDCVHENFFLSVGQASQPVHWRLLLAGLGFRLQQDWGTFKSKLLSQLVHQVTLVRKMQGRTFIREHRKRRGPD
jgi:hypothetical protein